MSVDEIDQMIARGLKEYEREEVEDERDKRVEIALPDGLPYTTNAKFLSLTERGEQELPIYVARNSKSRKSIMFRAASELNARVKEGKITVEDAVKSLRGYIGGGDWGIGFASQKVRQLINEGLLEGDAWFLKYDIEEGDYRKLVNAVEDGYKTLSSLATRLKEPEEKIRKMGGELAKRGVIFAVPGTVENILYSYREIPRTLPNEPPRFDFLKTRTKPIVFLDSEGKETKEMFFPIDMEKKGIEIENRVFTERTLLNNLRQIEEGKLKILKRKMKPTVDGVIHPLTIDVKNAKGVYYAALDYMPTLQMLSLIDYDFDSLKNLFGEEEFGSINRSLWSKRRFDTFSRKDDKRKTFDDSRRDKYHRNLFEKHVKKVRGTIQTAQEFFPYLNLPEINSSEANENKSAYMFFVAYCSKFAKCYDKRDKDLLGVSEPKLEKVGVLKLTERGREVLEDAFALPRVEITHSPFLLSDISKPSAAKPLKPK